MKLPKELRYTSSHEWVRRESDGSVSVGITDHAQEQLGDVVFVEAPQVGRKVAAGESIGVVESVKAASDIYAPVAGEVVAANADAFAAWMFRIKPSNPAEIDGLLDAAAYEKSAAE
jgi:glycine cleavage system H protein